MRQNARILVVDDEESMRRFFRLTFQREGYEVDCAEGVQAALVALEKQTYDLVLSDIRLIDGQGLEILTAAKRRDPDLPVIMMTAYASAESAVEAMKLGAADYLFKPFNVDEVKIVIRNTVSTRNLVKENKALKAELTRRNRPGLVYQSSLMAELVKKIPRIGQMDTTILVTGESGTGKELIMRMIHEHSLRSQGPFVCVNCGALPENLFESELFGYEKGAFTGADHRKIGLFESARGGSIMLDEIGEMPMAMQVKLLRVLQEKTIRRVGGTEEISVNPRVLAATNRNLQELVAENRFREDLYYRINVIPLEIPPLRERTEDIALLAQHFLDKFSRRLDEPGKCLSSEALQAMESYEWPGNVRELENTIERLVALTPESQILVSHLPSNISRVSTQRIPNPEIDIPDDGMDLERFLEDLRLKYMQASLEKSGGVQARACDLLGMSFRSFRYYLKKTDGNSSG